MEMKEIKQKVLEDVDPLTKERKRRRRLRFLLHTIIEFTAIIIIICGLFQIVLGIAPVEGNSMFPTLHDKDDVVYNRLTQNFKRGEVIVIDMPGDKQFVKRIVAVAGDTVNIEGGELYVNGKTQNESWAMGKTNIAEGFVEYPYIVKDEEVFVLGDNRENSEDSRMFGAVRLDSIKGNLIWYIGKIKI